jgi:hypothetical protein
MVCVPQNGDEIEEGAEALGDLRRVFYFVCLHAAKTGQSIAGYYTRLRHIDFDPSQKSSSP